MGKLGLGKLMLLGGVVGSIGCLSACASTPQECDPSKDVGYFGKIGCVVSGSYAQRVEQKEQQLANLQAEAVRINALTRELEAQRATLVADYESTQKMLTQSEAELQQVRQSLQKKQALSRNLEQQIADTQSQITKMREDGPYQLLLEREAERQQLENMLQELAQQLEAADSY